MEITDEILDSLIDKIETIRRRKIVDIGTAEEINYIDPGNHISKISSYNNHLIIGRRGSGKTTLAIKTINQNKKNFTFPVDCQLYRNKDANSILTTLFVELFNSLKNNLILDIKYLVVKNKYLEKTTGPIGWFRKKFNLLESELVINYFEYNQLEESINGLIEFFKKIEELPDSIEILSNYRLSESTSNKSSKKIEKKITLNLGSKHTVDMKSYVPKVDIGLETINTVEKVLSNDKASSKEEEKSFKYSKTITKNEEIDKIKQSIADIFSDFKKLTQKHIILYLDDFYLIPSDKQPYISQYFHDIYKATKANAFCFKICTIPNRIRLNESNQVDFSYKDDYSPIKLDKELYDLDNLKDFLLRVMVSLSEGANLNSKILLDFFSNESVLDYSIVATGGVPRDFIIAFAELIKICRQEGSNKIKKEHLYSVISDLREDKEKNIEVDSNIDPELLRKAIGIINKEIVEKLNTNVILYPQDKVKQHDMLLKNLVNLRYLHIINEDTTSENVKGKIFTSYLIDMTFYATGKRLKQGFDFRHFWEKDSESRHVNLRNAPIWSFKDEDIM